MALTNTCIYYDVAHAVHTFQSVLKYWNNRRSLFTNQTGKFVSCMSEQVEMAKVRLRGKFVAENNRLQNRLFVYCQLCGID